MAKRKKNLSQPTVEELTKELRDVNLQLKGAHERFDYICEPELIDACIYEIKYLKAKYDYLLRCIKTQTGECVAVSGKYAAGVSCAAAGMKGGPTCLS